APSDPMERFRRWWEEARTLLGEEADVMVVATAGADGRPSARNVLLRGFGPEGFVFYTNLRSRKARDLAATSYAALALYWRDIGRQVRVEGPVERTSRDEDEAYWRTRPVGAQVAAWVSAQSDPIVSRDELVVAHDEALRRFGEDVPLPEHWGGYRVVPEAIEFWQGREHRLHDRIRYERRGDAWTAHRLAP
ncbi:MAG TPA: pyridoxamine 5'-phosphate oxidase, partial [Actinomycetota bacterium]